jgi:hypothetical protein
VPFRPLQNREFCYRERITKINSENLQMHTYETSVFSTSFIDQNQDLRLCLISYSLETFYISLIISKNFTIAGILLSKKCKIAH